MPGVSNDLYSFAFDLELVYFADDTGPQSLPFRLNLTNLLQMASKLPYGDPSWAPPIRRGWGRLQEPERRVRPQE
jgi:hypothetical protein